MLDAPGKPFSDPAADAALFEAIEATFRTSDTHRLLRVPSHINDPEFAAAIVAQVRQVMSEGRVEATTLLRQADISNGASTV